MLHGHTHGRKCGPRERGWLTGRPSLSVFNHAPALAKSPRSPGSRLSMIPGVSSRRNTLPPSADAIHRLKFLQVKLRATSSGRATLSFTTSSRMLRRKWYVERMILLVCGDMRSCVEMQRADGHGQLTLFHDDLPFSSGMSIPESSLSRGTNTS